MINKEILISAILVLAQPLYALGLYKIPTLSKTDPTSISEGFVVIKSIKEEMQVVGNGFRVVIPKGWTLNPVGESEQQITSFNAHPTEDIGNDPVFIGIHNTKRVLDLKNIKGLQESKKRSVKEVNIDTTKIIQSDFISESKEQSFVWYVKTKSKNFIIMAGAPSADKKNIELLRSILKSLSFN